jgi:hypothetical protein
MAQSGAGKRCVDGSRIGGGAQGSRRAIGLAKSFLETAIEIIARRQAGVAKPKKAPRAAGRTGGLRVRRGIEATRRQDSGGSADRVGPDMGGVQLETGRLQGVDARIDHGLKRRARQRVAAHGASKGGCRWVTAYRRSAENFVEGLPPPREPDLGDQRIRGEAARPGEFVVVGVERDHIGPGFAGSVMKRLASQRSGSTRRIRPRRVRRPDQGFARWQRLSRTASGTSPSTSASAATAGCWCARPGWRSGRLSPWRPRRPRRCPARSSGSAR